MDIKLQLISNALTARKNAYTPYSHFKVGAALLCSDGQIFTGCNVENASYGNTICGERAAVLAAVNAGALSPDKPIAALAVVGYAEGQEADYCLPCGTCLQVLQEFSGDNDFPVISIKDDKDYLEYQFSQLLPHGFALQK